MTARFGALSSSYIAVELFYHGLTKDRLLFTGVVGTIVTDLCCFALLLVWLLVALGISALVDYPDAVLLPAFANFILGS